jgi:hypothetical protein
VSIGNKEYSNVLVGFEHERHHENQDLFLHFSRQEDKQGCPHVSGLSRDHPGAIAAQPRDRPAQLGGTIAWNRQNCSAQAKAACAARTSTLTCSVSSALSALPRLLLLFVFHAFFWPARALIRVSWDSFFIRRIEF